MPNNKRIEQHIAMGFEEIRNSMIQVTQTKLKEITQAQLSGMTNEAILEGLGDGWEQSFLNETAQGVWESTKWITQQLVYNSLPMSGLYAWQYNPGAKHCEVCTELHGQIKSFKEWEAEGLPGHRNEGCYANCCCDLVRVESFSKIDDIRKTSHETGRNLPADVNHLPTLIKEFENIDFNIDGLNKELTTQTYISFKYIQSQFGEDVFNTLNKLSLAELNEDTDGRCISKTDDNGKVIWSEIEMSKDRYEGGGLMASRTYSSTLIHEIMHFIFTKYNLSTYYSEKPLEKTKEIKQFYKDNKKGIEKALPFLNGYDTDDKRTEEYLVEAIAIYATKAATLYNTKQVNKPKAWWAVKDNKYYTYAIEIFNFLKDLSNKGK